MANNRMYLRCTKCGKGFFLGKTFLDGYYTSNHFYDGKCHKLSDLADGTDNGDDNAFLNAFNEFCDIHAYCTEDLAEDDIKYLEPKFVPRENGEENRYEIAYEFWYGEENEV